MIDIQPATRVISRVRTAQSRQWAFTKPPAPLGMVVQTSPGRVPISRLRSVSVAELCGPDRRSSGTDLAVWHPRPKRYHTVCEPLLSIRTASGQLRGRSRLTGPCSRGLYYVTPSARLRPVKGEPPTDPPCRTIVAAGMEPPVRTSIRRARAGRARRPS